MLRKSESCRLYRDFSLGEELRSGQRSSPTEGRGLAGDSAAKDLDQDFGVRTHKGVTPNPAQTPSRSHGDL